MPTQFVIETAAAGAGATAAPAAVAVPTAVTDGGARIGFLAEAVKPQACTPQMRSESSACCGDTQSTGSPELLNLTVEPSAT
jgi:hypothetical protein